MLRASELKLVLRSNLPRHSGNGCLPSARPAHTAKILMERDPTRGGFVLERDEEGRLTGRHVAAPAKPITPP